MVEKITISPETESSPAEPERTTEVTLPDWFEDTRVQQQEWRSHWAYDEKPLGNTMLAKEMEGMRLDDLEYYFKVLTHLDALIKIGRYSDKNGRDNEEALYLIQAMRAIQSGDLSALEFYNPIETETDRLRNENLASQRPDGYYLGETQALSLGWAKLLPPKLFSLRDKVMAKFGFKRFYSEEKTLSAHQKAGEVVAQRTAGRAQELRALCERTTVLPLDVLQRIDPIATREEEDDDDEVGEAEQLRDYLAQQPTLAEAITACQLFGINPLVLVQYYEEKPHGATPFSEPYPLGAQLHQIAKTIFKKEFDTDPDSNGKYHFDSWYRGPTDYPVIIRDGEVEQRKKRIVKDELNPPKVEVITRLRLLLSGKNA